MGLDLRLMVSHWYLGTLEEAYKRHGTIPLGCFDLLKFSRDYMLFGQIEGSGVEDEAKKAGLEVIVHPHKLPPRLKIQVEDEEIVRYTRKNPYGSELVYAYTEELSNLKLSPDCHYNNKAIMAYIKKLPKNNQIILEWC